MIDLKIDNDGDILLTDLDQDIEKVNNEEDDLRQSIKIILETKLGEYQFDTNLGISHLNISSLGGKNILNHYLAQDIQDSLMNQDDRILNVTIKDSAFNAIDRTLKINIDVETNISNDEINIESEVNLNGI